MKQEKDRIKELEKELNVLKQETNNDEETENNSVAKNTGRRPSRFEISSVDDTAMSPASTWTYDGGRGQEQIHRMARFTHQRSYSSKMWPPH